MSVDLIGHDGAQLCPACQLKLFDIALAFGFPAGTVVGKMRSAPFAVEIVGDDARALGAALRRAVTALRTGQKLTKEQANACESINVDMVCKLADYAERGEFAILRSESEFPKKPLT